MTEKSEWVSLRIDNRYSIDRYYPHYVRKNDTGRIIKECVHHSGYIVLTIGDKKWLKHRVVALQWIDNPNGYDFVDHVNNDRTDNHVDNLRWCSRRQNANNRKDQTRVDSIPEERIVIDRYKDWEIRDLYYYSGTFYRVNAGGFSVVPQYKHGNRYYIRVVDVNGVQHPVPVQAIAQLYNELC